MLSGTQKGPAGFVCSLYWCCVSSVLFDDPRLLNFHSLHCNLLQYFNCSVVLYSHTDSVYSLCTRAIFTKKANFALKDKSVLTFYYLL